MFDFELEEMIQQQLVSRGISDQRVIQSFRQVSRKIFVPEYLHNRTYGDERLPVGLGQTISPPYLIARMLQELKLKETARVLEIGTGSGYQAALLSVLASDVYTMEILPELSARARKVLVDDLGITNVTFRVADGRHGWSDAAPFDAIILNAVAEELPWSLEGQLRPGGRAVAPIGDRAQELKALMRPKNGTDLVEVHSEPVYSAFAKLAEET